MRSEALLFPFTCLAIAQTGRSQNDHLGACRLGLVNRLRGNRKLLGLFPDRRA